MAFLKSDDINYRALYLGGGSVHGVVQAQALIFLEEIAGVPIAWQYDMLAGDSIGSTPAAALNMPIRPGSKKPKFTAQKYHEMLVQVAQKTFEPYREDYYNNMVKLELKIRGCEESIKVIQDWSKHRDKKFSDALEGLTNKVRDIAERLGLKMPLRELPEPKKSLSGNFNLHSGLTERTVIPIIKKILDHANTQVETFFFSAEPIHTALDTSFTYPDGSLAKLSDCITGFHSEAFNINKREAEAHTLIKPIKEWEGHLSHKDLPLAEIPKRSMPAQTIFKPYFSPFSEQYYDDIAAQNTMAASMNAIRRKFDRAIENKKLTGQLKRHGVSIGTGLKPPNLDPERMGKLLILGRLDSSEGAPLLNVPLLFNTSKAIRDLEEELGQENAIFIDKIIDRNVTFNKQKYKDQLKLYSKEFARAAERRGDEDRPRRLTEMNPIDARDERINMLEDFGWAMVWDHLEILVNEAKEGLRHALDKGYIDECCYQKKLKKIDTIFPPQNLGSDNKPEQRNFMDYLTFGGRISYFGFLSEKPEATEKPCALEDDRPHPPTL